MHPRMGKTQVFFDTQHNSFIARHRTIILLSAINASRYN